MLPLLFMTSSISFHQQSRNTYLIHYRYRADYL